MFLFRERKLTQNWRTVLQYFNKNAENFRTNVVSRYPVIDTRIKELVCLASDGGRSNSPSRNDSNLSRVRSLKSVRVLSEIESS